MENTKPSKQPQRDEGASGPWWRAEEGHVHERLVGNLLSLILESDRERRHHLAAFRSVVLDLPFQKGYGKLGYERFGKVENNALLGSVEATVAALTSTRPKAKIVSVGGDWSIRQRVKMLNQWSDGEVARLGLEEMHDEQVLNGAIDGTGLIKVSPRFGRPFAEPVWAGDCWVDPREERYLRRKPLSFYQYGAKDRAQLEEEYGDTADAKAMIRDAGGPKIDDVELWDFIPTGSDATADLVSFVEGWRLPVGDLPGRHVIGIDGLDLLDEPWTWDCFPFSIFRWGIDPMRFWGQGLVERGVGAQAELNNLTGKSRRSYGKWFPCYFVRKSAKLAIQKISDKEGDWYEYEDDGSPVPPVIPFTPGAVGAEIISREQQIEQRVYSTTSGSQLEASGEVPQQLSSGKAILSYKDQRSIRFGPQGKRYEDACVQTNRLTILTADAIAEDDKDADLAVLYDEDGALKRINFGEARIPGSDYRILTEPISKMADTLSGKLEQIEQMNNLGLFGEDKARVERLLDVPDLHADQDLAHADQRIVDRAIEACLDTGEPVPAHSYMDTTYAMRRIVEEINRAEMYGAPEGSLEALRVFMGHCEAVDRKKKAALAAEQAAAMGPPPMAPPMGADPAAGAANMGAPGDSGLPPGA